MSDKTMRTRWAERCSVWRTQADTTRDSVQLALAQHEVVAGHLIDDLIAAAARAQVRHGMRTMLHFVDEDVMTLKQVRLQILDTVTMFDGGVGTSEWDTAVRRAVHCLWLELAGIALEEGWTE